MKKNIMKKILTVICFMSLSLSQTGIINLTVEFDDYTTLDEAAMIMAYIWAGDNWETAALVEGADGWAMFLLVPPGTFNGTYSVSWDELESGTYYVGVFETTGMAYETAIKLVGYYNSSVNGNNSLTEPEGVAVDGVNTVNLETMVAPAEVLEIYGEPHFNAENYTLLSSYPNPFNPSTRIDYVVPVGGIITLSVFNVWGQKLSVLVDGYKQTGGYSLNWYGTNNAGELLPAGPYFVRMEYASIIITQKITLLK